MFNIKFVKGNCKTFFSKQLFWKLCYQANKQIIQWVNFVVQVCEEFKTIARQLYDKPNSIEELAEQREYMKQIPEQLKKNQELIDKAMIDYELIEEFNYNISAEDFNAK